MKRFKIGFSERRLIFKKGWHQRVFEWGKKKVEYTDEESPSVTKNAVEEARKEYERQEREKSEKEKGVKSESKEKRSDLQAEAEKQAKKSPDITTGGVAAGTLAEAVLGGGEKAGARAQSVPAGQAGVVPGGQPGVSTGPSVAPDAQTGNPGQNPGLLEKARQKLEQLKKGNLDLLRQKLGQNSLETMVNAIGMEAFRGVFDKNSLITSHAEGDKNSWKVAIKDGEQGFIDKFYGILGRQNPEAISFKPMVEIFRGYLGVGDFQMTEMNGIIAMSMGKWYHENLQKKLSTDYIYLAKYEAFKKGEANLDYDIQRGSDGFDVKLDFGAKETEYRSFHNEKEKTEKASEKQKVEQQKVATEVEARVGTVYDSVMANPITGPIAGLMGETATKEFIRNIETKGDPFWKILLGFVGVGVYAADFDKSLSKVPEKGRLGEFKSKITNMRDKVRSQGASYLEQVGIKPAEVGKEPLISGSDLGSYFETGAKDFGNGMRLKDTAELKSGGKSFSLTVDMNQGGEIVLPAAENVDLKVGDSSVKVSKDTETRIDKTYSGGSSGKVTLNGRFPAGTKFRGQLKFEKISA